MDANIDFRIIFSLMNGKVSTLLKRRLNENFHHEKMEISSEQWDVLLAISMRDTCTKQQLSEATSFSKTTMTRILDSLENKGIILRSKTRVDWRSNYIRITRYGQTIRDKAKFIAVQTMKDSLRGLTREDVYVAQKSLNTVLENLKEMNRKNEVNEAEDALRERRDKLLRRLMLHKKY